MNLQREQAYDPDLDDRKFVAAWLLVAAGIHMWAAAGRNGIHAPAIRSTDLVFAYASYGTLAYIVLWSYCVLFLGIEGSGRRTIFGVLAMLLWPIAALAVDHGHVIWPVALANGLAAFAMFGRRFPIRILDGLFTSSTIRGRALEGGGR